MTLLGSMDSFFFRSLVLSWNFFGKSHWGGSHFMWVCCSFPCGHFFVSHGKLSVSSLGCFLFFLVLLLFFVVFFFCFLYPFLNTWFCNFFMFNSSISFYFYLNFIIFFYIPRVQRTFLLFDFILVYFEPVKSFSLHVGIGSLSWVFNITSGITIVGF